MEEEDEKSFFVIRIFLGIFLLVFGVFFMIIPFIPLGYLFILVGLFFLSPIIPALRKLIFKLERKDSKGIIKGARNKSDKIERKIHKRVDSLKSRRKK